MHANPDHLEAAFLHGNNAQAIFHSDEDCGAVEELGAEGGGHFVHRIHTYFWMCNPINLAALVVETPPSSAISEPASP